MTKQPRLADVSCVPMRFQPGDRLLVKHRVRLDADQKKKLKKTVEKWAGDHVEVLLVDLTAMDIEWVKR